jgi:DNA-binding NarL/FixJ family response regulator
LIVCEEQVLELVANGLADKRIAEELSISEKMVSRRSENIFAKLNVASRAAAATFATHEGIV